MQLTSDPSRWTTLKTLHGFIIKDNSTLAPGHCGKLLSVNTDGCRIFKMQVKPQPWETARLDILQYSEWELASLGCNSFVTDRLQNILWSHQVYILGSYLEIKQNE